MFLRRVMILPLPFLLPWVILSPQAPSSEASGSFALPMAEIADA